MPVRKKKVVLVADIIHLIDKSPYFSSRKSVEEEEEEETKKPPKSTSKAKERSRIRIPKTMRMKTKISRFDNLIK